MSARRVSELSTHRDTHVARLWSRRAWVVLAASVIVFAIIVFGVAMILASVTKPLRADAVAGEWVLSNPSEKMAFVLHSDGRFESEDWPLSLSCAADEWPTSLNDIDWNARRRMGGEWQIDEIDSRAISVRPDSACSTFSINASPVVGDSSLRIHLDLTEEPAASLVFSRK